MPGASAVAAGIRSRRGHLAATCISRIDGRCRLLRVSRRLSGLFLLAAPFVFLLPLLLQLPLLLLHLPLALLFQGLLLHVLLRPCLLVRGSGCGLRRLG